MNKFLTTLDTITTRSFPYAAVTTLTLSVVKLLGYNYSWLLALSPILIVILAVGVINFFSFCLDQD